MKKVFVVYDTFMCEEPLLLGIYTDQEAAEKHRSGLQEEYQNQFDKREGLFSRGQFSHRPTQVRIKEIELNKERCGIEE